MAQSKHPVGCSFATYVHVAPLLAQLKHAVVFSVASYVQRSPLVAQSKHPVGCSFATYVHVTPLSAAQLVHAVVLTLASYVHRSPLVAQSKHASDSSVGMYADVPPLAPHSIARHIFCVALHRNPAVRPCGAGVPQSDAWTGQSNVFCAPVEGAVQQHKRSLPFPCVPHVPSGGVAAILYLPSLL